MRQNLRATIVSSGRRFLSDAGVTAAWSWWPTARRKRASCRRVATIDSARTNIPSKDLELRERRRRRPPTSPSFGGASTAAGKASPGEKTFSVSHWGGLYHKIVCSVVTTVLKSSMSGISRVAKFCSKNFCKMKNSVLLNAKLQNMSGIFHAAKFRRNGFRNTKIHVLLMLDWSMLACCNIKKYGHLEEWVSLFEFRCSFESIKFYCTDPRVRFLKN